MCSVIKEKLTMTKRTRYIFSAVALLLCVCALLCSCGKGNKFVMKDGMYVDKKTNVAYHDAPSCYEPLAISDEKYGMCGEVELFKIVGADPTKWLCEATGTVFYADGVTLPALNEMNTSYATLFYETETLAKITDASLIAAIAKAYVEGETLDKPSWSTSIYDVNWRIKFADETIGICYILAYFELNEDYIGIDETGTEINYGRRFLYNRFEDKMVVVDDMLAPYVEAYKAANGAN